MKSLRRHEGYYVLDHRMSPGNSRAPEGKVFESALFVCPHCQRGVLVHPDRARPRNYCAKCDAYTCDTPFCVMGCNNMERVIEKLLEEAEKGQNHGEL